MTKRSSHMPLLTMSAITNSAGGLDRTRRNQSACGSTTLQRISVQYTGAYGPVIRLYGTNISNLSALYHAMNASVRYPYATMRPVTSMTFAMFCRWRSVMKSSRP